MTENNTLFLIAKHGLKRGLEKGLLEWRLSTETAVKFLKGLRKDCFLEISYDDLVNDPVETIERVLSFIGVDGDHRVTIFARDRISRKSKKLDCLILSEKIKIIGGVLLPASMGNDSSKGLTNA